ncbi:MAG TPA: ABC transporter ATP-binding protein [Gemmatimonadales bacterium]
MSTVALEHLSKEFDGTAVVRDLTLDIPDGELLVLVGPSGCGKTTTLRMIAGLEVPTSGRILIGGEDVTAVEPGDRDIAMVFQNYALYPHLSVGENLAFGLRMRRVAAAEVRRRVGEVAAVLGLEPLLDRKPAALSGGQRQRVALGRAMVRDPRVFLFDEPLSNLDAQLRAHTRTELARLHRDLDATMIYVTHDQTEAMTLGGRIAILHRGELQQMGTPLEVYDRPASRFVAGFIGAPSMNFLSGRLEGEPGAMRFASPDLGASLPIRGGEQPDAPVVLGIRPEQVRLAREDVPSGATVDAIVRVIEPLGSETLVVCRAPSGTDLIWRTPTRPALGLDAKVRLGFDPADAHWFADGESGRRLPLEAQR